MVHVYVHVYRLPKSSFYFLDSAVGFRSGFGGLGRPSDATIMHSVSNAALAVLLFAAATASAHRHSAGVRGDHETDDAAHDALEILENDLAVGISGKQAVVNASAVEFPISAVTLAPDSLFGIAQQRNLEYQLSLNDTQWLCQMTSAANLTTCVGRCAVPGAGGGGVPLCEQMPNEMGPGGYYGHYQGHYLSATAAMYNNTQDSRIKAKMDGLVDALAAVQDAWAGKVDYYGVPSDGYIFPNYPDVFGIMEVRCGLPGPNFDYSVPYYSLHKLMAGLLDQYQLAGNARALRMATAMADWVVRRVAATLKRGGPSLWQCVLGTEWGGMNDVLYNLHDATGGTTPAYLETGQLFNHWQWTAPLAVGDDDLDGSHGNTWGNHANTHIPEVIGTARGYELTGNETQKAIAVNFFTIVTANHSWATGGSNEAEHWTAPNRMGDQLTANTEESCTQYNILKVARHLFKWTASSALGDFYERAVMNGIIGNQNNLDPAMTSFIYMLPLGAASMHKPWGSSDQGFPCCWGTLTEQFSRLSDSIYFASPDHSAIFVNLFMSSSVRWAQRRATVTQVSGFPASTTSTTAITVGVDAPATFSLKVRVPSWATTTAANNVTVNGQPVATAITPGTYLDITREWRSGDVVDCHFPMALWSSGVRDDRPAFNATVAFMYGPLVLAGLDAATTYFSPASGASPFDPAAFIKRIDVSSSSFSSSAAAALSKSSAPPPPPPPPPSSSLSSSSSLTFVATGRNGISGTPVNMTLIPLYTVMEESYAVYFNCQGPPSDIPYVAASCCLFVVSQHCK
jgi:DUF1680 family protein